MPASLTVHPGTDLSAYPLLIRSRDLAKILSLHEKTVLAATMRGDRMKVPAPAMHPALSLAPE